MPARKPSRKKAPQNRRRPSRRTKPRQDFLSTLYEAADARLSLADLRRRGFQFPVPAKKLRLRARELFERVTREATRHPLKSKSRRRKRRA